MKKTLFLTLILICFNQNSFASDKKNDSSEDIFNFDIFSLTKKKESSFDAPSSVYVLSSEDIRRSGATSIPEAFRLIPGVQVARIDGSKWAISVRGFNHQYSSKLLIMVDGRVIYTPIFSGVLWDNQDYVLEDVEKIEVIRGPGGTIWGANAMNGIINIITKSSSETQGVYVSQIFGNQDNSITEARYGGKINNLDSYRVYAKHANRDGFTKLNDGTSNNDLSANNQGSGPNNDGIVNSRAGFRYDATSFKDISLKVHGDIFENRSGNYFNSSTTEGLSGRDKHSKGTNLVVNLNKDFSTRSSLSFQAYFNYEQNDIEVAKFDERTLDFDFQHFYSFSNENQFAWGLGYRNVYDNVDSSSVGEGLAEFVPLKYIPSKRNNDVYSAFIQDKIPLVRDKLYLTIGTKFEHNDQTGTEYQPNARIAYYPSRNQTFWVAASRAVRTPTKAEDSADIKVAPNLTVTRGSPTALAETVMTYEMGYRIEPTRTTLIDAAAYFSEYSRLGAFDSDLVGTPTASNTGRAKTFGGELTAKWQVNDDWRLEAGYDFLKMDISMNAQSNEADSINDLNVDKLVYFESMSPRNQFRLRSFYNMTPRIELDNVLYYVDSLPSKTNIERGVPSYIRWDTRLGYLATRNLDLSFGVQNILDDKHQEFNAGLFNNKIEVGRTYYAKAVFQF